MNTLSFAAAIARRHFPSPNPKFSAQPSVAIAPKTDCFKLENLNGVDFTKGEGLIPTIVQNEDGAVLMLAYSSPESLRLSLESGRAIYFSRSRGKLWNKGQTQGDIQELKGCYADCDKDALLFVVKQHGTGACHLKTPTCFDTYPVMVDPERPGQRINLMQ